MFLFSESSTSSDAQNETINGNRRPQLFYENKNERRTVSSQVPGIDIELPDSTALQQEIQTVSPLARNRIFNVNVESPDNEKDEEETVVNGEIAF